MVTEKNVSFLSVIIIILLSHFIQYFWLKKYLNYSIPNIQ